MSLIIKFYIMAMLMVVCVIAGFRTAEIQFSEMPASLNFTRNGFTGWIIVVRASKAELLTVNRRALTF